MPGGSHNRQGRGFGTRTPPYAPRESGGRSRRQSGQVRKEAAVTISLRVVPAPTFPEICLPFWPDRCTGLARHFCSFFVLSCSRIDRLRSEERRVGKECVSPCGSRGSP